MEKRFTNIGWAAEVDVGRLLKVVLGRAWLVIMLAIICAVAAYGGTKHLVTPQYQSAVMLYVNNGNVYIRNLLAGFTSDTIWTARSMIDTYEVLLLSRTTLEEVLEYAGISETVDGIQSDLTVEISEVIEVQPVNETEIFRIIVERPNPDEAERIADAIANVLPRRISEIMDRTSAKLVDAAVIPRAAIKPNLRNSLMLGGLFGMVLGVGIIVRREFDDSRIESSAELAHFTDIQILSEIPDLASKDSSSTKGKYY